MRIGILTFHKAPNYGAMLQAYALQEFLKRHDCEVLFINCSYICQQKFSFWGILLSRNFKAAKVKLQYNCNMEIMCSFAKNLKETRVYKDYNSLKADPPDCDIYIVGSDQMWNPAWCMGYIGTAFLNFGDTKIKRASYAVSFGTPDWPEDSRSKLKNLLERFDHLSVREESGVELIRQLSGQESKWLPDPTLLFAAEFYKQLMGNKTVKKEPYCFRYALDWDRGLINEIQATVTSKLNIKSVLTQSASSKNIFARWIGFEKRLTVEQWVANIAGASFVLTDSFHGTIFSILFRRPFITLLVSHGHKLAGMNERLISLLKYLRLEDRMLNAYNEKMILEVACKEIDWEKVNLRLAIWRSEAGRYIDEVLNNSTQFN